MLNDYKKKTEVEPRDDIGRDLNRFGGEYMIEESYDWQLMSPRNRYFNDELESNPFSNSISAIRREAASSSFTRNPFIRQPVDEPVRTDTRSRIR